MPDTETPSNAHAADPADPGELIDRAATADTSDTSDTSEPFDDQQRLDGNAAGGVLDAIFSFEMTMAVATCAGCGTRNPLGAVMAYMHGMGTILRCPTCDTALIRVAHIRARYYVDLRGMRALRIAEEEASA
jgi:hypothetical protein